jgi:hypothetical protein
VVRGAQFGEYGGSSPPASLATTKGEQMWTLEDERAFYKEIRHEYLLRLTLWMVKWSRGYTTEQAFNFIMDRLEENLKRRNGK